MPHSYLILTRIKVQSNAKPAQNLAQGMALDGIFHLTKRLPTAPCDRGLAILSHLCNEIKI